VVGAGDVVVCEGEFEVVDMEVEAGEDDADFWVEKTRVPRRDLGVVRRRHVAPILRVAAADVGDVFAVEFGFDAALA